MNTFLRKALSLAPLLTTPFVMLAQVDRSHAPAPGPAPDVHVAASKNSKLANGMQVIVVENHKLPIVSVQFRFDHPPILQGPIAGYQDLIGEMLTSGTARRTKQQIDDAVDRLGAQFNGNQDGLYASSLKKNFPELMRLAYEVITSATFPANEFEKVRTRYISGLKSRADDPDQIADVVSRSLIFGKGHPYGEVPTEATMAKVNRGQLFAYYQYFFRPESGYIVFVGDITNEEARKMAEDMFGGWTVPPASVTKDANGHDVVKDLGVVIPAGKAPLNSMPRQMFFVDRPGSAQSVIKAVLSEDLKPGDPMVLQSQVLNTILGGGVFNARLMQNLREDKGYTYGAYSSMDVDRWGGSFSAGCSVRNAVTDSAVSEIMFEIEHIKEQPITGQELALAKSYMAGSFARSLEDPRTIARFALNTLLNDLPKDYYSTYLKRLDTVTVAGVQAAAERYLQPDNLKVLVVGDKEEVANKLAPLSFTRQVVYLDANGDPFRESFEMPPAGMTAKQVLDAYIKAIGGSEALLKIKSLRKEYTADMQGMKVTLLEQYAAPNKYAMSLNNGAMVLQKLVFDGVRGKGMGVEGEKDLLDEELDEARQSAYMFPELFYQQLDYLPMLNGVVDIDGHKCYRILVRKASGPTFTEYYDQATGLKVRRVETQPTEEGTFQVTTDMKDYKDVDGVKFPSVIDQNAGMNFHFVMSSIEVNKPIDPGVFSTK